MQEPDTVNQIQSNKEPVYVIGPSSRSAEDLARYVEMPPEWFKWISSPRDLDGTKEPLVAIMPNWWVRGSYSGMEQQLQNVNARIFNVHFGHFKPNWKGQSEFTRSDFIEHAKRRRLGQGQKPQPPDRPRDRPASASGEDKGNGENR